MLKLSKLELRALSAVITGGGSSVKGLAFRQKVSLGLASRAATSLERKGFVKSLKTGASKFKELSDSRHAQEFKRLLQSRPNASLDWLSGFGIEILVLAGGESGIVSDWLEDEASCSKTTLNKVVKNLLSVGALGKIPGGFDVSDGLVRSFANACADWQQLQDTKGLAGYNVSVRVRKHVVLRTEARKAPDWFMKTGLNELIEAGLNLTPTSYTDYYYSLDEAKRELSIEEKFIHAVLLSTLPQHAADKTSLALFLASRRGLDYRRLNELAARFYVEGAFLELRRANELREKMDSL